MSLLLPPGIDGLADCPFTLQDAILKALHFLGYEELPTADRPPRKIWLVPDEMEAWWEKRDRIYREKYGDPDTGEPPTGPSEHNPVLDDMIDYG